MNDNLKIVIEIPNTGLEEAILRKGEWEDDSLFGRTIRNALRQFTKESVCLNCALDKIRAEIEQVLESCVDGGDWFADEKVNECLEIIDKYKVER